MNEIDNKKYMEDNKAATLADFQRLVGSNNHDFFIKLNSLGDMSIVEYLCLDNLERLYDVVGLLRNILILRNTVFEIG
jgi:hypothetical protein